MKQIVSNYSYSPTTNVVTLTGVNIDADQLLLIVAPQVGRTMYNFASGVTGAVSAGANTRVTLNASTVGLTTTSPLVIFYDDQASTQPISGTVTANVQPQQADDSDPDWKFIPIGFGTADAIGHLDQWRAVSQIAPLPVSNYGSVTIGSLPAISGTVTARLQDASGNNLTSTSIGGVQRLNVSLASAATPGGALPSFVNVYGGTDGSAVRTISVDSTGRQNTNPQFPRVTLIDGSGTVTTANTAITVFASSSTRSYLLVQVTTGSAFVNVGATATTVNGINLTAGQGYSWETTIPQGVVSLISTTTSSRYVAKEA